MWRGPAPATAAATTSDSRGHQTVVRAIHLEDEEAIEPFVWHDDKSPGGIERAMVRVRAGLLGRVRAEFADQRPGLAGRAEGPIGGDRQPGDRPPRYSWRPPGLAPLPSNDRWTGLRPPDGWRLRKVSSPFARSRRNALTALWSFPAVDAVEEVAARVQGQEGGVLDPPPGPPRPPTPRNRDRRERSRSPRRARRDRARCSSRRRRTCGPPFNVSGAGRWRRSAAMIGRIA